MTSTELFSAFAWFISLPTEAVTWVACL